MNERRVWRGIVFEWHTDKARINRQKHGVDFVAACEVFFDPFLMVLEDDTVHDEQRGALIGLTEQWRLLYVVYTLRGDTLRIISARPATIAERKLYENQ